MKIDEGKRLEKDRGKKNILRGKKEKSWSEPFKRSSTNGDTADALRQICIGKFKALLLVLKRHTITLD